MAREFQYKTIPSRWLEEEGHRLDCGPYMSGAIEARELLRSLPVKKEPLKELTHDIFHAGREGRLWVNDPEYGIPFMGSGAILAADLSRLPLIAKKQVAANPKFSIHEGWTLITRSGTVGRMAYARSDMDGLACSEHVMRVNPDEDKVLPGYIFAYLNSKFGVPLVVSGTYGAIIQHIEPHHIAELPVPRLGKTEDKIHQLIQQSADLLTKYQANIQQATHLFFDSVGLKDITSADWHNWGADLGFSKSLHGASSLRALNFNPRFEKLCAGIKQGSWKPLGEICKTGTLKSGARFTRIDAEPEFAYQLIGQKQIFWLRPEGRWIARHSVGKEVLVPDGAILVAAQGTLGEHELFCRSEFITGKRLNAAYSQHFLRVITDKNIMLRGCLFAFLRSETAFRMLRSISIGSKLQDFHHLLLNQLPIPYPPKEVQQKIHTLIVEAYTAREQSIDLEDQARTLVEQAIEQGAA